MKKSTIGMLLAAMGMVGLLFAAEPTITADATSIKVTVPANCATGAKLVLAYAAADRGTQLAAWTTTRELAASVPAEGGEYSATFADLGFPDGNCVVRAFTQSAFEKLDYLIVDNSNDYVDVGLLDTDLYGVEFGYKPTGGGNYGKIICCLDEGGAGTAFRWEGAGNWKKYNFCGDNTSGAYIYPQYAFKTDAMNTVSARNNVLKVNGSEYKNYRTSPIGLRGARVRLNTKNPSSAADHAYGWWYYLRIYGADGLARIDYVPAQRTSDNLVGFYDQVEKRFITPTGGGAFGAGTVVADSAFTDVAWFSSATEFVSKGLTFTVADNVATVVVPAGYATGEKLYLVADELDRGIDVQAWHDIAKLSDAIPAEGGTFTHTLTGFCTYGANVLRVFTSEDYTRLASVTANAANAYRDTGVLDSVCYGVEYGYQPLNGSGTYGKTFASVAGTLRWERVGNGNSPTYNYCVCNSKFEQVTLKFTLDGNACNNIVFRNGVLTHNGISRGNGYTTPVDNKNSMLRMNNKGLAANDKDYGKWYHMRLYARNGVKLVNYVPAKNANGTYGFVDLASREFITPTGGGSYASDNVEQGTVSRIIRYTATTAYDCPTAPVTAEWIGGADTDLTKAANWRCRNFRGEELPAGTMPNPMFTAVTVTGPFAFSVPTADVACWCTLKFDNAKLAADADWRGSFSGNLAAGFTLDLDGHTLTVDDLQGSGTITDTSATGGELRVDIAQNGKGSNTCIALTGSLKLVKTGAGEFRAMTAVTATYTGGTLIDQGVAALSSKAQPTASSTSFVVSTNGVFDLALGSDSDAYVWTRYPIILAGGTIKNSGIGGSTGAQCLGTVRLEDDSKIISNPAINFIGSGYANTCLDLNGHTLSLNAGGSFRFYNTEIKNGCLKITDGGWIDFRGTEKSRNGVDASTAVIELCASPRLAIYQPTSMGSLIVRAADTGKTVGGTETIKIVTRLVPYTDYIHNYQMQNGSTIDLSIRDTVYPTVNPANNAYKVTFAEGATITIDLHGHEYPMTPTKVMSWPEIPANVTFVPDAVTRRKCYLKAEADGLYVANRGSTVIYIR